MKLKIFVVSLFVLLIILFVSIFCFSISSSSYEEYPECSPFIEEDGALCKEEQFDVEEVEYYEEWLCNDFLLDYYVPEIVIIDEYNTPEIETPVYVIEETVTNEELDYYTSSDILYKIKDSVEFNKSVLIHILYFEVCGCKTEEDIKEQEAVLSVIINRFLSCCYPGCYDLEDVIFFKYSNTGSPRDYAYTPASDKDRFWKFVVKYTEDDEEVKNGLAEVGQINEELSRRLKEDFENNYNQLRERVESVLYGGCTVPKNIFYSISKKSYNDPQKGWKNGYCVYCIYDDTVFLYKE